MKEATELTKTIILAGGVGERLRPLTLHRAKPAVPFGGKYRIIDFPLSNGLHSRLRRIHVLSQYEHVSLNDHLVSWSKIFSAEMGDYLRVISPRGQAGKDLTPYTGTADAVMQNMKYFLRENPEYILILAGDQIYRMDYREIIGAHRRNKADLTMAVVEADKEVAQRSGVVEIDDKQRVIDFAEKPENPRPLPDNPDRFFVSMSVYVFNTAAMIRALEEDSLDPASKHDFGRNIIPNLLNQNKNVFAFPLLDQATGQAGYWRDVGTLQSYYEANMDLCAVRPAFNLYDRDWFWRTAAQEQLPPAKTVFRAEIRESLIGEGCIIDDADICHSVISPEVRIGRNVVISNAIIMAGVQIEDNVVIDRAIIDKGNKILAGSVIRAGGMNYHGLYEEIKHLGLVVIAHHEGASNGD